MRLHRGFGALSKALAAAAKAHYGRNLVSLVLFGSAARGTARFDSDLDFLVVAERLPRGRMRRVADFAPVEEALAPLLERLASQGFAPSLSPVFKTVEEARAGSPLFLDMVEDGVILHDRGGFFAGRLGQLRARLRELGAKRVHRGNAWYWDLKPDYRPGTVVVL